MSRLLVHLTTGPQDPTKVTLALLVARTAAEAGHQVDVFLAGDAVHLIRPETRNAVHGVGTGSAQEHWSALESAGAQFYGSRLSAAARAISPDSPDVGLLRLVPPTRLVELTFEADRILVY